MGFFHFPKKFFLSFFFSGLTAEDRIFLRWGYMLSPTPNPPAPNPLNPPPSSNFPPSQKPSHQLSHPFPHFDFSLFLSSLFSFLKFKLIFFDYFFIIKIPFSAVSKWFYESLEETPCENDINSLPYIPEVFSTYHPMFCLFNFK